MEGGVNNAEEVQGFLVHVISPLQTSRVVIYRVKEVPPSLVTLSGINASILGSMRPFRWLRGENIFLREVTASRLRPGVGRALIYNDSIHPQGVPMEYEQ